MKLGPFLIEVQEDESLTNQRQNITGWATQDAAELFSLTSQIGTETPNSSK
jgi:hypothetical protein